MDYERELGAVIGKMGKDIPRERALEHVLGFTLYNDMTARDLQDREMRGHVGPAEGKDFDKGNVLICGSSRGRIGTLRNRLVRA